MRDSAPVQDHSEQRLRPAPGIAARFYRPELDALRFFAFLGVLLIHGPSSSDFLNLVRDVGGFGLSMFFLLSAYLITELLLRERETFGTISWGRFFIRRALRIWPLYYAALIAGILIYLIPPHSFWVSRRGVLGMAFFVYNWLPNSQKLVGSVLGPLWSISVEEQFYLVWPPIIMYGGRTLALAASIFFTFSAGVWLSIFSGKGWKTWYDTPVEFLFFAAGAIIAIATHGNRRQVTSRLIRGTLLMAGLCSLAFAGWLGRTTNHASGPVVVKLCIAYGVGVAGCSTIFAAVFGMSYIPRALAYLGKISYGLYVFHGGMLIVSRWLTEPLKLAPFSAHRLFIIDGLTLLLCIPMAHLSYQYFEKPFLKFKERFEAVKSRPI